MDAGRWSAPRTRTRTLTIVGVAAVCGFVAFMAMIAAAFQGLDTGDPRSPWPLVVMVVVALGVLGAAVTG